MRNWLPLILLVIEKILPILIDELRQDDKKKDPNDIPQIDYENN